jgi:RNA polymerase sigma-70 factor (ECF subfamily)
MSDESMSVLRTAEFHLWIDRMRDGDDTAAEQLLRHAAGQLERMARKMLRRFPGVGRWEQTDDLMQNAVVRLLRALKEVRPNSVRAFFGLAAALMRRELIDLARHYQGPQGHGANHASVFADPAMLANPGAVLDPADQGGDGNEVELWAAFHAAVESLPPEEREVVGLTFYHGWTQVEIATLFQVDERTVRRRWRSACQRLSERLHGRLPALDD